MCDLKKILKYSAVSIVVLVVLFIQPVCAQNMRSAQGLKMGMWDERDSTGRAAGKFTTIDKDSFTPPNDSFYMGRYGVNPVMYKGLAVNQGYDSIVGQKMSVKDSVWSYFDSAGRLGSQSLFDRGVLLGQKRFDEYGQLYHSSYDNYDSDSSVTDYFIGGILFRREVRSCSEKFGSRTSYFPGRNLEVSYPEISMRAGFFQKRTDTETVVITAKKEIQIRQIISDYAALVVLDETGQMLQMPHIIKPGDELSLQVVYLPGPLDHAKDGVIRVITNEEYDELYFIVARLRTAHLFTDEPMPEMITLSKRTYPQIIVSPGRGGLMWANLLKGNKVLEGYVLYPEGKVMLSELAPGIYELSAHDEGNANKSVKLKITE